MAKAPRWEPAYCEFFAARQRSFLRTAYAMLGSWSAAEDATQQTFVALYARWPRISPDKVDAYGRRVLVNTCFAVYRRRGREVLVDQVPERGAPEEHDERLALLSRARPARRRATGRCWPCGSSRTSRSPRWRRSSTCRRAP